MVGEPRADGLRSDARQLETRPGARPLDERKLAVLRAIVQDYVGTEQKRFFTFQDGKLIFGPAPNSVRNGDERLSRRLTLERVR